MNILNKFNPWRQPTIEEQLNQELYEAQMQLLQHQTQADYYQHMVRYNQQRIQRLRIQQCAMPGGDHVSRGQGHHTAGTEAYSAGSA